MPSSGSSIFTDADGYQASLRDMFDLLVERPRGFQARLTWVELPHLRLLRAHEASARVAYLTLPQELVFVTFPAERGSLLICGGATMQFGDVMFHSRGEHLHQRTTGASRWGAISLTPASLLDFGRALLGKDVVSPPCGRVLRLGPAEQRRLLRLHTQAARLAERDLGRMGHTEIARALEQDLVLALLGCLAADSGRGVTRPGRRGSDILLRLETVLSADPGRLRRTQDICDAIGTSPQTLRVACKQRLGMSPGRYQRLRRLKLVRAELIRSAATRASVDDIMRRYWFADIHRFVTEYWNAYGEMPPIPPRDAESR
jgi:AraC-like DNA-binding protein